MLPESIGPHSETRSDADEDAVEEAQEAFFEDEATFLAIPEVSESKAAKGNSERLCAGVSGLSGKYGQEGGKNDDSIQSALKVSDDGSGDEAGEEIDLKPGVAEAEAAEDGGGEALFVFNADHGAGLGADFDGAGFEEILAADETEKATFGIADRVDGVVSVHRGTHGGGEFQMRLKREDAIAVNDFAEALFRAGEEEVAHDEDAEEAILFVGDVTVGDDGLLSESAQAFDGLCDGHLGAEDTDWRFHEPADAVFRIGLIAHPLAGFLDRGSGEDLAALLVVDLLENLLSDHGVEAVEGADGVGRGDFLQDVCGFVRSAGLQKPEKFVGVSLIGSHGERMNPTALGRN